MGVGEALGADVAKTNGSADAEAGAVPQEASNNVTRKINLRLDDDDFM